METDIHIMYLVSTIGELSGIFETHDFSAFGSFRLSSGT